MDMLKDMLGQKKLLLSPKMRKILIHPGGRKFIFFNQFSGDIIFSSLVSFAFLILVFFFVCLFDVF